MPNISLTTTTVGSGIIVDLSSDVSATGFIAEGVSAASFSSWAVAGFADDQQVTVAGSAMAGNSSAVYMSGSDARVSVLASGQVSNTDNGAGAAIYMAGASSLVTNLGAISGGAGVEIVTSSGGGGQVVNHGTISGVGFGYAATLYNTARYGAGILLDGGTYDGPEEIDPVRIINTGVISGATQDGYAPGYAILMESRVEEEDDQVSATEQSNVAAYIANSGQLMGDVRVLDQADQLENSGEVHGDIRMGGGDDWVDSRLGQVFGTIQGEDGNDSLIGGEHSDIIDGGADNDSIIGLDGADELIGGSGEDTLRGGAGDDTIDGGSSGDEIRGGSGDDYIDGNSGGDDIRGESGDDTILGGSASDTIDGGSGEENIDGGSSADLIYGRSGDDFIRGDSGSDTISGGAGADTISGGTGHDEIDGGSGGDRIFGGSNDDTIEGTLGDDYLDGGGDDDVLRGGSDNDTLIGNAGQDELSGGNGADVFVFNAETDSVHGTTRDTITDFEAGVDMIDLSGIASGLTFVSSYTSTAGEVRYNDTVGRLYIDVDGDGGSDFSVDLVPGAGLTESDLIL
ncbi:calcium-binding protein [uncultured Pelagimonas sp.]|uniref:calcium-binding protein n=1 Tax=uncultured Pelagimonas sp. TaxID=1618102 RepID=UPI00261B3E45|nr:calcium-binding protein [uncultured Pelagimonas sp.]